MGKLIKIWLCILSIAMVGFSLAMIAFECIVNEMAQCSELHPFLISTICINGFILFLAGITEKSSLIWINIIVVTGNIAATLRTLLYEIIKVYFNPMPKAKHLKNIAIWLTLLFILSLCSSSGFIFRKYHYEKKHRHQYHRSTTVKNKSK
ncbi:putative integral membrane protein [Acanthocheilonema viteae]